MAVKSPSTRHERTKMEYLGRSNYKHTYSTGRRGNVWFYIYKCPVCGIQKQPCCNTSKGIEFYCDGKPPKRKGR